MEDDGGEKSAVGENSGGGGLGGEGVLVPDEFLSASTVESHPFDAEENALCMSLVKLEQGGSPRMHVAVGTGMNDTQGEDKAVRGFALSVPFLLARRGALFFFFRSCRRGPVSPFPYNRFLCTQAFLILVA